MKTILTILFALILLVVYNSDYAEDIRTQDKQPNLTIYVTNKTKDVQDDYTTYYLVTNTNKLHRVSFETYTFAEVNTITTIRNPITSAKLYLLYFIIIVIYFILLFLVDSYQKDMF